MDSPPRKAKVHELGGGVDLGREDDENRRADCARGAAGMQGQRGIVAVANALAARGFFLRRTPTGMFIVGGVCR